MDAVTYPNEEVADYLTKNAVCFKPRIDEAEELAREMGVLWTPGLVWLDHQGTVQHSNIGYFEPSEFLPEFAFGCAKVALGRSDWKAARRHLTEIHDKWPESNAAPAALYWQGVASKRDFDDVARLLECWRQLLEEYPASAWAAKVRFIEEN